MTNYRKGASRHAAILDAIHKLGPDTIQDMTGKSVDAFYKAANPNNTNDLSWSDATTLAALMVANGFTESFSGAFVSDRDRKVEAFGGPKAHSPADLRDRLAEIFAEVGDVASEVREATHPNGDGGHKITIAERKAIADQAKEARDALDLLIKDADHGLKEVV